MSNILNIINEDAPSIVRKSSEYSEFLPNNINSLRTIDESIFEATTQLHQSLLESNSKEEENKCFAEFFKQYSKCMEDLCMKAVEFKDEFSITIENFIDANNELIEHTEISDVTPTKYTGAQYRNLLKEDIISIKPYKAFKKEFAFIGKLFQDLNPLTTEQQKTEIIATICNNLSKEINDGWLDKCIKKITGDDEVSRDSYTKKIYNMFVEKSTSDIDVDTSVVEQCRLALSNYNSYILSLGKQLEELCEGLDKISEEIGSMFFRNQDRKMVIKTDVEGVEDRTYKLSEYTFNQFNIFISTKVSQITELCNIYMTALSIKADCIYKYLKQCRDIIEMVRSENNVNSNPASDDTDNDGMSDSVEADAEDNIDDIDLEEDYSDNTFGSFSSDNRPSEQDDESSDDGEVEQNDDSENNEDAESNNEEPEDIEEMCYLFIAEMYNAERLAGQMAYNESMLQYVTEDNTGSSNPVDTSSKKSMWGKIKVLIDQVSNMINKFMVSQDQIAKLLAGGILKNKDTILKTQIPSDWTIQRLNMDPIINLNLVPYNENDADLLADKDAYLTAKYGAIMGDAKDSKDPNAKVSVKDRILKKLLDEKETPYTDKDRKDGLDFLEKGVSQVSQKVKQIKLNMENAEKKVQTQNTSSTPSSQQSSDDNKEEAKGESALYGLNDTMITYFTEDDNGGNNSDNDSSKNKENAIKNYVMIHGDLTGAILTIAALAVNKHRSFLKKLY